MGDEVLETLTLKPLETFKALVIHRYLFGQLVKRDVLVRYRGAMFGVLWIFLSPLLLLAIFAFVFGYIFPSRWPQHPDTVPFWLMLYIGLIVFNIFSDTVSRAPLAVRSYPSYVKRIIFPVDLLPLVPLGAALVHSAFNTLILFLILVWFNFLSVEFLLFPLLLLPVFLLSVGSAWFLAAWGVFIKDMSQIVPLFVQMLLFLSPVLYPASAVPGFLRSVFMLNPISAAIEAARNVAMGTSPNWSGWALALFISAGVALLGHAFFQHSRDEFADAI